MVKFERSSGSPECKSCQVKLLVVIYHLYCILYFITSITYENLQNDPYNPELPARDKVSE